MDDEKEYIDAKTGRKEKVNPVVGKNFQEMALELRFPLARYLGQKGITGMHQLSYALGITPKTFKKALSNPLNYLTLNQLVMLSFYIQVPLQELVDVCAGEGCVVLSSEFTAFVRKKEESLRKLTRDTWFNG